MQVATIDDVHSEIKQVNEKMDTVIEWKGTVDQRCEDRGDTIDGLQKTLFGNPAKQDGVVSKVQALMTCKNQVKNRKEWAMGIVAGVLKWAIIAIIVWLLVMWKTH